MAGGLVKYRHLGRNSAARQALLRGLVTSLVTHEHIQTTWPKAKEAQRLADKLITLAKRNNEATRRKAQAILYVRRARSLFPARTASSYPTRGHALFPIAGSRSKSTSCRIWRRSSRRIGCFVRQEQS